jgi:hypothetical protein
MSDPIFTGYDPSFEDKDKLYAACLDYDFSKFVCSGDIPETRGIMDMMTREDQYSMNSCGGFGMAHTGQVCWWLQTGDFREFNPHWCYVKGQEIDGRRTDSGVSIRGVVEAAKRFGLLPQDVENDGKLEYAYPRDNYRFRYPKEAAAIAAQRKVGYSVAVKGWKAKLNFLQANQGAIVNGGSWGNWKPDRNGICRKFARTTRYSGGYHARAYVDWITINGEVFLVEANSHFKTFGKNGYSFHSEEFIEAQERDPAFVAVGVSDITLGPNDQPKQRKVRRFVKLV